MPRGLAPVLMVRTTWSVAVSITETVAEPSSEAYAKGADAASGKKMQATRASSAVQGRIIARPPLDYAHRHDAEIRALHHGRGDPALDRRAGRDRPVRVGLADAGDP